MFKVRSLNCLGNIITGELTEIVVKGLHSGDVIDLGFMPPEAAKSLLEEFNQILDLYTESSTLIYKQLLVVEDSCIFNWGTVKEEHAVFLELKSYKLLNKLLLNIKTISNQLRSPNENLFLSVIPSIRKTSAIPRFYHRESHTSLDQLKFEGKSASIYRLTCDLGLENTHEVINVNLVPRHLLLDSSQCINPKYEHLFQRQHIEFLKYNERDIDSIQKQMSEDMLPFPDTCFDLLPGRALIWFDHLFFHTPYLKNNQSSEKLLNNPRSIVIINEFCKNSYRSIKWSTAVKSLLNDIIDL